MMILANKRLWLVGVALLCYCASQLATQVQGRHSGGRQVTRWSRRLQQSEQQPETLGEAAQREEEPQQEQQPGDELAGSEQPGEPASGPVTSAGEEQQVGELAADQEQGEPQVEAPADEPAAGEPAPKQPAEQQVSVVEQVQPAEELSPPPTQSEQPAAKPQLETPTPSTTPAPAEVTPAPDVAVPKSQQPEAEAPQQIEPPNSSNQTEPTARSGETPEKVEQPEAMEEQQQQVFVIDRASCEWVGVPEQVLNMTVSLLVESLRGVNCSRALRTRLEPLTGRLIRGQVLETSSMPLDVSELLGGALDAGAEGGDLSPAEPPLVRATCLASSNETKTSSSKSFGLLLEFEPRRAGPLVLRNRWRLYPRSRDHLAGAAGAAGAATGASSDQTGPKRRQLMVVSRGGGDLLANGAPGAGDRCEPFKLSAGDYQLHLLEPRLQLALDLELAQLDGRTFGLSAHKGGSSRLRWAKFGRLYLEHEMGVRAAKPGARSLRVELPMGGGASVQVLHDNNNHHRRNNWLLDFYANWQRHEHLRQLRRYLALDLAERVSSASCLAGLA